MSIDANDGAAVRLPPPLVYLGALVVGGVLHELVLPLSFELPLALRIGSALASAGLGLGFGVGAMRLFRQTGQDPKPWVSTPEIVSTGVYRFTRNPMYVGGALLQIGIGIGWANGWVVLLAAPAMAVVYATAIRHEEAYLERKFGEAYLGYKRSVRRWL